MLLKIPPPPKKDTDGSSKRRNFNTIFKKGFLGSDWSLRLDLGILCCLLFVLSKVDEIFDNQKVLSQYFDKHYPELVIPPWAAERALRARSKILGDSALTKKLELRQGLFSIAL